MMRLRVSRQKRKLEEMFDALKHENEELRHGRGRSHGHAMGLGGGRASQMGSAAVEWDRGHMDKALLGREYQVNL